MSFERVLQNNILVELRNKNIISNNEVAVVIGDLYYAKDVLTNKKRMLDLSSFNTNESNDFHENNASKRVLKG
jgi:hypothetical protein